jgi:predicted RNA binding protein YcfA (HicA-like mRNA interferase family)
MAYSTNVWNQLKNLSVEAIISALLRDGWKEESRGKTSGTRAFMKVIGQSSARIVIHYHPGKTYGPKFLRGLLSDIGWSEDDLRRLKLIK